MKYETPDLAALTPTAINVIQGAGTPKRDSTYTENPLGSNEHSSSYEDWE